VDKYAEIPPHHTFFLLTYDMFYCLVCRDMPQRLQ
jgi:hypothetical protein